LNAKVCSALLNREITHSAFRLYVALVLVVPQQKRSDFAEIYVDKLKEAVPGVRGKPLGDGPLRESLQELQRLGLIEMAGRPWSRYRIHVKLPNRSAGTSPEDLQKQIMVPGDQAWRPDVWRQSQ
jgi:hypothetical protein